MLPAYTKMVRPASGVAPMSMLHPMFGAAASQFHSTSIRRFLPPHQLTPVEFTPEKAGEYEFTCGMGMLRGKLIVR